MGLLARIRESAAMRGVKAALEGGMSVEQGSEAARRLATVGSDRCVSVLCAALGKDNPLLQAEAVRALTAIRKRRPDAHVLEAVTAAILNERMRPEVRKTAVECFADVVELRRAGCLVEVLRSARCPILVRAAAVAGLKKLGYGEVIERLVESALFGPEQDPRGEIRRWAVRELVALGNHETPSHIHEIMHGRRKLLNCSFTTMPGGRAVLIPLMVEVDPKGAQRFLHMMADDENPAVRQAAAQALHALRGPGHGQAPAAPPPA